MENSTLNAVLLQLLGSQELVELWWASPNKAFDGEIPDDLLHSSRHNEVVKYVLRAQGGDFS